MTGDVPYVDPPRRRISRRVLVLSALALAGLGGIAAVLALRLGGPTSRFEGFVYIESNRSGRNSILAYRFSGNRLRLAGEYPTGGRGAVDFGETGVLDAEGQIAVDLGRRLLFAVNQGSDTVAVFHIQRGGTLTQASGSPFRTGGKAPASVAVAREFLLVVDKAHDAERDLHALAPRYAVFRIGAGGVLRAVGTPVSVEPGASPTQALPAGNVVVGTEELGPFRSFVLGADGSLVEGPGSPFEPEDSVFPSRYEGARWSIGLASHPTQALIYVNQPAISKLLVYAYDRSGRLTFVRSVDNGKAKLPCWTVVTPDGRRLYTANAGNGTVSAFDLSRDPSNPRRLQTLGLESAGNPWGLALDPAGRTLFVVDPRATFGVKRGKGNRLHALAIGADGRLEEIDSSPVKLPVKGDASPLGIAIVPG